MIQVSNEFKQAIKNPERKIKGYVEVLYDNKSVSNDNYTKYYTSTYTNPIQMVGTTRVSGLYGTLDYLPLDGSRLAMSPVINVDSGFISDNVFEDIQDTEIIMTFDEMATKGITLYFRTNIPTSLTLELSDGTIENIQDNNKDSVQIIFDEEKTITSLSLTINDMEYQDRKIYINQIDFGITQVYKDQDLIEFTVDEEVNKLVEEVPTNETNIILNNMSDLFNPLNPSGIVPYLSENTLIKPYIGVLTDGKGIEYVKMGEFYFDSYTNNPDATTTLVGKNIIKQIESREVTDGLEDSNSTFFDLPSSTSPQTTEYILDKLNLTYTFTPRQKIGYYLHFLDDINLMNFLKNVSTHDYSILYANRDNKIIIRDPITSVSDSLTKQELITDAEYKKIERINTIIKNDARVSSEVETSQGTNTTIFSSQNAQFIMTKSVQNFAIKNETPSDVWQISTGTQFTYTGVTSASIVFGSNLYTIVEAVGEVGSNVSFNCIRQNATVQSKTIGQDYEITNRLPNENKVTMEINSTFNAYPTRTRTDLGLLEYTPSYEMRFDYNGDPSLEAGDYINVETPYGYKTLFIQKNKFKFDGGLEGSIEGVE